MSERSPGVLDQQPPAAGRVLELADFGIELRAANDAQRLVIDEELRYLNPHAGPASIQLNWSAERLDLPDDPSFTDDHHREYFDQEPSLALRSGSLTAIADERTIQIGGSDDDHQRLARDFSRVFSPTITYALGSLGVYPVHAAAIARAGRALLLVGHPGSGKSSAAWGAHGAGFDLLGDDTVFVRRGDRGVEIHGMRKSIVLPREVLSRIPDDATRFRGDGGSRDRWEVPPSMQRDGWYPLSGIIIAAHDEHAEGSLDEVDRAALLRLLVGSYYSSDHPVELRRWFPRAAELSRLPAWSLLHSCDIDRRLDVAAGLLDRAHRLASIAPADH